MTLMAISEKDVKYSHMQRRYHDPANVYDGELCSNI